MYIFTSMENNCKIDIVIKTDLGFGNEKIQPKFYTGFWYEGGYNG